MNKRFIIAVSALMLGALCYGQRFTPQPDPENLIYVQRGPYLGISYLEGRSYNFAPTFFIYPDSTLSKEQAKALVEEFGMQAVVDDTRASIMVINPLEGKYNPDKDFEAFVELFNRARSGNLKLIGIGAGADFINSTIAPRAHSHIAGILTIDGKAAKSIKGKHKGVPAYIYGKNATRTAKLYEELNAAEKENEPLLKVVTNTTPNLSKAEIFADAWTQVLGTCYRFNNYKHTHYEGCKFGEYGTYELEPYTDCKALGIERVIVEQKMGQGKPWLWYEYWPIELKDGAPEHSVPVVVLLHGNTNDPRTQAETSGFIDLQGEERFFVVEMEWQGNSSYDPMGHDGIEQVIGLLMAKYPQLDPGRVYCEGLSAGSMTSTAIGVKKSHVFAAVAGHSGGVFGRGVTRGFMPSSFDMLWAEASQKRGVAIVPYCSVLGTADKVVPYITPDNYKDNGYLNAWNIYEQMNGVEVVENLDFSIDPIFGQKLDNRQSILYPKGDGITVETGEILKGEMPVVKIVAVMDYGHWNFKPTARIMWDFFKHYSRDQKTFELIYTR